VLIQSEVFKLYVSTTPALTAKTTSRLERQSTATRRSTCMRCFPQLIIHPGLGLSALLAPVSQLLQQQRWSATLPRRLIRSQPLVARRRAATCHAHRTKCRRWSSAGAGAAAAAVAAVAETGARRFTHAMRLSDVMRYQKAYARCLGGRAIQICVCIYVALPSAVKTTKDSVLFIYLRMSASTHLIRTQRTRPSRQQCFTRPIERSAKIKNTTQGAL